MKKYILISIGLIMCIILLFYYMIIKGKYTENFLELDDRWMSVPSYQTPYEDYAFYGGLELPKTIEPILKDLSDFENDSEFTRIVENYINRHVKDYLSREKPGYIHYIPLYNPDNLKREGFLLLSAGIDGKINNRYDWRDTLYLNDLQSKLKLYDNNKIVEGGFGAYSGDRKIYFNIFNYFFGRKDILIAEVNYIEFYKNNIVGSHNFDDIERDNDVRRSPNGRFYSYKVIFPKDTIIDNDRYIFFQHDDYLVRNKLYDGRDFVLSDTMFFVGTTNGFDKENKIIDFRNCIQVEKDVNNFSNTNYYEFDETSNSEVIIEAVDD